MSISAFSSPFPLTGALGLSVASIDGGSGTGSANAATIAAGSPTAAATGPFSILQSSAATTTTSPTIAALTTGALTNEQHTILSALGNSPGGKETIPYAAGKEPNQITAVRDLGWIKLDSPVDGPTGLSAGVYSLTPIGQAIFKRTSGGALNAPQTAADNAPAAASTPALSSVTNQLSAGVQTVAGLLSQVGVNVNI